MNDEHLDYFRLARAILVQALDDAKRARYKVGRQDARAWLTEQPNRFRDAILSKTNLTQDDLDRYVRELEDA